MCHSTDTSGLPLEINPFTGRQGQEFIEYIVDTDNISKRLSTYEQSEILTSAQRSSISVKGNEREQAEALVDLLSCKPRSVIEQVVSLHQLGDRDGSNMDMSSIQIKVKAKCFRMNRQLGKRFSREHGDEFLFNHLILVRDFDEMSVRNEIAGEGHVALEDIFTEGGGDVKCKRVGQILIRGVAGSGKSTLCQHIAHQWADTKLWPGRFSAIFIMECRFLDEYMKGKGDVVSLEDILFVNIPEYNEEDKDNLLSILENDAHSALIIIDGLDEVSGLDEVGDDQMLGVITTKQKAPVVHILKNIINGELLNQASFIFTSRPNDTINSAQFDRNFTLCGFGEKETHQCILSVCNNDQQIADTVVAYLEARPYLYTFCNLPIACILIAKAILEELTSTEREHKEQHEINCSTILYIIVVRNLLRSRNSRMNKADIFELFAARREQFMDLICLAKVNTLIAEPKFVFSTKTIQDEQITIKSVLDSGLLEVSYSEGCYSDTTRRHPCSFLHNTIQEFLSAIHLALNWDPSTVKLVTRRRNADKFDLVLLFTVGLLGHTFAHNFLKKLDENITSEVLNQRREELIEITVKKFYGSLPSVPPMTRGSKEKTKLGTLRLIRYIAEGNQQEVVKDVERRVLSKGLLDLLDIPGGLQPQHLPAIVFFLENSTLCKSVKLHLSSAIGMMSLITTHNHQCLVPFLDECVLDQLGTLNLRGIVLADIHLSYIVKYIEYSNQLKHLDIGKKDIGRLVQMYEHPAEECQKFQDLLDLWCEEEVEKCKESCQTPKKKYSVEGIGERLLHLFQLIFGNRDEVIDLQHYSDPDPSEIVNGMEHTKL